MISGCVTELAEPQEIMSITATPHHHSQHTLALTNCQSNEKVVNQVVDAFRATSDLPCETWSDVTGTLMLASNYEDCILEDNGWAVLVAGFCYR